MTNVQLLKIKQNMRKGSYNGSDTQRITNRTMTVASNFKFQNLQRLNTIVGQVSGKNNKQVAMRAGKTDMSDKVLDLIKNRIKTNCDKLYQNYDQNKKAILKQIQQVESNMLSENAIHKGLQNVIKQKSTYDRSKTELQTKQKKLKKLNDIRDQLKGVSTQNKEFNDIFSQKFNLIQNLQSFKDALDYQSAVLNNMKSDRRNVKLFLKQKYDRMLADEQFKKQRIKKLQAINHNKKANLKRIEEALKKQQHCEIPQNLAGQLQRKLQQYEGKHIYQNIIKHENIISEDMRRQFQIQEAQQREQAKKLRLQKQKQDMKQYQLAYNFYLIKQQEEQKIKKICGVSSLSEIVNNSLQSDFENLQTIKAQTQASINEIKTQNQNIKDQISKILTGNQQYSQQDLIKAENQFVATQKELKSLEINSERKYDLLNQWHALVQLMSQKQLAKADISSAFKQMLELVSNSQSTKNQEKFSFSNIQKDILNQKVQSKFKKFKEQYDSECSILDRSMI